MAGCGTNATLVTELQRKLGPTKDFSIVNVTKPKQVQNWADDLIQRHGAPDLLIANAGVIVTPSSVAGRRGYRNIAPSCMSKHAVEGITKSLALELPDTMAAVPSLRA